MVGSERRQEVFGIEDLAGAVSARGAELAFKQALDCFAD
jgi:hypothetical protein